MSPSLLPPLCDVSARGERGGGHCCGPSERPAPQRDQPRRHGRTLPLLDSSGYIDYHIPRLGLLEGTYELTAAIQDWSESHDYDHWRHGLKFDVLPSTVHEEGYVSLGGTWRLETASPSREERHVDAR